MPLPNLLIVGSQKSGTSWLHRSLGRSKQIFSTELKELNFFNQTNFDAPEKVAAFRAHFPEEELPGVEYYLESTPHYFRARRTTPNNILSMLGTPAMLVVFRDPVDRYESACIHHMMRGRIPYTQMITELTDDHSVLSFGRYAEILKVWWDIHPQLHPLIYDDLVEDPLGFVEGVMDHLGLESDLTLDDVTFRTNDKDRKKKGLGPEWKVMPQLSPELRARLRKEYAEDTRRLEGMLGRDLSQWRENA